MSPLFVGIDGGQTGTVALVADGAGRILGRAERGPADDVGQGPASTRFAATLEGAVGEALAAAGLPTTATLEAVVAGISGYEDGLRGVEPALRARTVRYLNDAPIALAGALEGPGVVLIAGTGSVAYGRDASGATARAGGWGYVFGDEGSAFWIARRALETAAAALDEGRASPLGEAALAHFGRADLRGLVRAFYREELTRPELAGFAPRVAAATAEDEEARAIVAAAADALARAAERVVARLRLPQPPRVALCGGAFASEVLRATTARRLRRAGCAAVAPLRPAVVGALRLAYEAAGIAPPGLGAAS